MDFVAHIKTQAAAMRAAAMLAGPQAPVPTCPEWTVFDLVTHMARVHSWAGKAMVSPPSTERPRPDEQPHVAGPGEWDTLLTWWDERLEILVERLRTTRPDTPVWTFNGENVASFWSQRQAHETAIHRLDAEHAVTNDVPTLLFDSEFAADGVDEFFARLMPRAVARKPIEVSGKILFHAADAGRTWEVVLTPGEPVVVGPVHDSAIAEDCTVAGTADAIYRAVWDRPSHAVVTGDRSLLDALPRP